MDGELKNKLDTIKKLVSEGKVDDALNNIDMMLEQDELKPYESALKKIKIDIIYGKNLARIDDSLGKKTYEKVVSELDSAILGTKTNHAEAPKPTISPPQGRVPPASRAPVPGVIPPIELKKIPLPTLSIPKELIETDPYDLDNIDIIHEVGPAGVINDMRRTFASLFDPNLPMRLMLKEVKKSE